MCEELPGVGVYGCGGGEGGGGDGVEDGVINVCYLS